jgi:Outer membrane efflux protein
VFSAVEQMAMRQYRFRVARVAVVAVAMVGLALPAFAQARPAQPRPPGPVRQLSMEAAISLALQNNLGLRVERINPELQDLAIAQARTVWTPNLTGSLSTSSRTSPISGFFSGATDKLTRENLGTTVGANQVLPWGANYSVGWDTTRNQSNSVYDSPNPSLLSNLTFSFTQPLLRNLKVDSARNQLVISKMNREVSDIELRQTVLTTVRNVKYGPSEQQVQGRDRHDGAHRHRRGGS